MLVALSNITFNWGVAQGVDHWYRVQSQCLPRVCPPVNDPDAAACTQGSMTTLTVMASSLEEVATKLINSNWVVPVAQVIRYDPPAKYADWTAADHKNASCRTMVDVTSQFNEVASSLMMFLNADIDIDVDNPTVLDMLVEDWYIPAGSTSLRAAFTSSITPQFGPYQPIGGLSLRGGANWGVTIPGNPPVFYYHATGGLRFGYFPMISVPKTGTPLLLRFSGASSYVSATWYHNSLIPINEICITGVNTTLVDAGVVASASAVSDESNPNAANPVVIDSSATVDTYCCATSATPVSLYLNQNLSQSQTFINFINRNNLTWSNNYLLNYRAFSQSWQTSIFFKGFGTQQETLQNWQLNFDFGCSNPSQQSMTGLAYLKIVSGGDGTHPYNVNDILTVGYGGGTVRVTTVNAGLVTAISVNSPGAGYAVGATYSTTDPNGSGQGCTLLVTACATTQGFATISNYWKFGMNVALRDLVLGSNARTRLIFLFDPSVVCPDVKPISFNFTYNTQTQEVIPATVSSPVIFDGLGLFKSQIWFASPLFNVTISATQVAEQQTVSYPELMNPIGSVRGSVPLGGVISQMT